MGFPKLLCRKSVIYPARSTVFWRAIPNFVLVFRTLEMLSFFFSVTRLLQAMQVKILGFQDFESSKFLSTKIREILR